MRKIVIGAALLLGASLFTTGSGTPAQAAVGCLCGKIGAPAVCVATITDCNFKNGGVCVLPCVLEEPKMSKKPKGKKAKAMKSKAKKSKKM